MIDLNFGLFWSGAPLSYLRYLTFKTLRYHHPYSRIQLFVSNKSEKHAHKWNIEKQDFEVESDMKDYLPELSKLNVEVIRGEMFAQFAPNYASDLFRWWWLNENGGFYLDTDQIILRPFKGLPEDSSLVYSKYVAPSCGIYTPVGVIGAKKGEPIVKWISENITKFYNCNNYNSLGPFMFRSVLEAWKDQKGFFNAPRDYFYPICDSCFVHEIYRGTFKIPKESFALHLFGGHPLTQEFNKGYTEEFAKNSNDTISSTLRGMKLL